MPFLKAKGCENLILSSKISPDLTYMFDKVENAKKHNTLTMCCHSFAHCCNEQTFTLTRATSQKQTSEQAKGVSSL